MPKKIAPKTKVAIKSAPPLPPSTPATGIVYRPTKRWRGLLHMPEFYILFVAFIFSGILSYYLLVVKPTGNTPPPTPSTNQPVGQLTKAIWTRFDGGFFSFRYPPTWQLVESTPSGFEAVTSGNSAAGKLFTSCRLYLQIPEQPKTLIAIDIHRRESNSGYCWSFGYFFDDTNRRLSSFPIMGTITVQKWMYPHAHANEKSVQKANWQGDYFQMYKFLGTLENVSFSLLNQERNKKVTESDFDQILSTFTFILSQDEKTEVTDSTLSNNEKRRNDINTILNGALAFKKENGFYPPGIPQKAVFISSQGARICQSLVPKYLGSLPMDPTITKSEITDCTRTYSTGYQISLNGQNLTVTAPYADTEVISVSN